MTQTLDSFSTLLSLLTQTFLLEEPRGFSSDRIQRAVANHQASFTSLKKSLIEAQSERLFGGPGRVGEGAQSHGSSGQAYEDAIDSLNRLGQHLNGLRSGITLQHELIRSHREGKVIFKNSSTNSKGMELGNGKGKGISHHLKSPPTDNEEIALLQSAATVFGDLLDDLGPPLKALSVLSFVTYVGCCESADNICQTHCISTLKRLREAFVQSRNDHSTAMQPADFVALADNIERALFAFESTSNHAVLRMYRSGQAVALEHSRSSAASLASENQLLMGDESETVFLVYLYASVSSVAFRTSCYPYSFIFTLQEYARELISLVDAMGRICSIERANAARGGLWRQLSARLGPSLGRRGNRPGQAKTASSMRKRFCKSPNSSRPRHCSSLLANQPPTSSHTSLIKLYPSQRSHHMLPILFKLLVENS